MKRLYDIRSETGLYHDRIAEVSEREALIRFAGYKADGAHVVQCGKQRPYLVIDGVAFYAEQVSS